MIYPPLASPAYSRARILKPNLTAAQRRRRKKKDWKKKMRRHNALLYNSFISPAAAFMARLGLIPRHFDDPYTKQELRNFLDECNSVFYGSTWARPSEYLAVLNGPSEVHPKLPRLLRAVKCHEVSQEHFSRTDLTVLKNGHIISINSFRRWHTHGFTRFMFKVIEEKSVKRCCGEWAVMFPFEMKEAFPSISFEKKNYRKWYLVQVVRDETGLLTEVRVFSPTYAPVLRMELELKEHAVVPENCQKWWTSQDLPMPTDWDNLNGPVTEEEPMGPLLPPLTFPF